MNVSLMHGSSRGSPKKILECFLGNPSVAVETSKSISRCFRGMNAAFLTCRMVLAGVCVCYARAGVKPESKWFNSKVGSLQSVALRLQWSCCEMILRGDFSFVKPNERSDWVLLCVHIPQGVDSRN